MNHSGAARIPAKTLMIIAAVAVLVLVASLFVVRALIGDSAPDAPTGLSVTAEDGRVKAAWSPSSGADEYILIRDDGAVVYQGSASHAVDETVATGEHTYKVRAENGGHWSTESAEATVTVESGWGQLTPLVSTFPELLPATPESWGWQNLQCRSMVRALKIERGDSDAGSGDPLVRARLHCFNAKLVMQPSWMTSKNAVDQVFSDLTKTAKTESISWRYGTGYYVDTDRAAFLRLSDRDDVMVVVTLDGGGKKELLDVVNTMPMEK